MEYERGVLKSMRPHPGESIDMYHNRVAQQASLCEYGTQTDSNVKSHLVITWPDEKLRLQVVCRGNDMPLQDYLTEARTRELCRTQVADLEKQLLTIDLSSQPNSVNRVVQSKPRRKFQTQTQTRQKPRASTDSVQCTRCGRYGHSGHECRCSKGHECKKCHKIGHFENMCRSVNQKQDPQYRPKFKKSTHRVRQVQDKAAEHTANDHFDSSDSEYVYLTEPTKDDTVQVLVKNIPVPMVIDSGASCNIIDTTTAEKLKDNGVVFTKGTHKINPFRSDPIVAHESTETEISVAGYGSTTACLLVVSGNIPQLLGKDTSTKIGVLQIMPTVNAIHASTDLKADILKTYPGIADGVGKLKKDPVKLHINTSVPPVARKHDHTPFHLRPKVEKELQRLLDDDIIEPVTGPTDWLSCIVCPPKPHNIEEIRICVDMRDANCAIQRTRHVTPTITELKTALNGAKYLSKIDLRSGYHQLVLDPSCRYITNFSTHMGLFRYKRLFFGVNSAAEVFQHTIQSLLTDIPGARNISDDIIVFGNTQSAHDEALTQTLTRLHESGLTINLKKCAFNLPSLTFFGHTFSADGIAPDKQKVQALVKVTEPQSVAEVRSFLGMAQYSAHFIHNFATITAPLRKLVKKNAAWTWGEEEQKAFLMIKQELSNATATAYFDPQTKCELLVDGSPVGIAAILSQNGHPIAYASRSLTEVEQRYSQLEREALAVVWSCEHFHIYIYGEPVTVYTDHQPLLGLWRKPHLPPCIARWSLRLQPYDVTLVYRKREGNPADFMSKTPYKHYNSLTKPIKVSANQKPSFAAKFGFQT